MKRLLICLALCSALVLAAFGGCTGALFAPPSSGDEVFAPVSVPPDASCSEAAPDGGAPVDAADQAEERRPALELGTDAFAFRVQLQDVVYALPCPLANFLADGWLAEAAGGERLPPGEYADVALRQNGLRLTVRLANPGAAALPLADCNVAGVARAADDVDGAALLLPGGIALGSLRQDVLDLLGQPDGDHVETAENTLSYTAGKNRRLCFSFDEADALAALEVWNLTPLAPAPAPQDLPPQVQSYTPPAALPQDWRDMAVEYGGSLYTLPAPVAAFLENGWQLRGEETVPPGGTVMRVCLAKGNQVLRAEVSNLCDTEQPLWACYITMIESSVGNVAITLALAGGVGLHTGAAPTTYEELVALWGKADEVSRYGTSTWDAEWRVDEGRYYVFRFAKRDGDTVKKDELVEIEVWAK